MGQINERLTARMQQITKKEFRSQQSVRMTN